MEHVLLFSKRMTTLQLWNKSCIPLLRFFTRVNARDSLCSFNVPYEIADSMQGQQGQHSTLSMI